MVYDLLKIPKNMFYSSEYGFLFCFALCGLGYSCCLMNFQMNTGNSSCCVWHCPVWVLQSSHVGNLQCDGMQYVEIIWKISSCGVSYPCSLPISTKLCYIILTVNQTLIRVRNLSSFEVTFY